MHLQIDIKPIHPRAPFGAWKMNQYINGSCYSSVVADTVVQDLIRDGIVHKTKGQRHDKQGNLVEFDYPDGVDGAGVAYTSKTYKLDPATED